MGSIWFTAVLALTFLTLFLLERRFPLRAASRPLWRRVGINLIMSALAFATAAITVGPAVAYLFNLSPGRDIGLLALFELPVAVEFVIAFLLFDWTFYWWHRAHHQIPLLWRFHNVHHVDPDLDVTTAARFHVVEIGYSAAFRGAQVILIGPLLWMYLVYELVFQAGTLFHHSNVKLPLGLERVLNRVIVTPRMHGIHHSQVRDETNSNYSTVFSWWDRLHSSLRLNVPQREIHIGVPAYSLAEDNKLASLLTMPFHRQRAYWQTTEGTMMTSRPASPTADTVNRLQS